MEPELTYTHFAEEARNNSFNREQLQKGFNNIEQSDPILLICLLILIYIPIDWVQEIRNRAIQ